MTKEQFTALPAAMALGILWDVAKLGERLANVEAPKVPFSPKYDARIYRKDGFQWASETNLESLRFWHGKMAASAAGNGEYAAKDAKRAETLERWIKWRECFPDSIWSGERDETRVTAAAPSGKPELQSSRKAGAPPEDADASYDTDIPF